MKKRLRFSKKDLNIWVETETGDLKMMKVPYKLKSQYIQHFIPNRALPTESQVLLWLSNFEGYILDI